MHTIQDVSCGKTNIPEHLDMVKETWSQINLMGNDIGDREFKISNFFLKVIIASSLPPSWDLFTENYISGNTKFFQLDPKKSMSSQEFIGVTTA
jgi:hypothetical protein